MKKNGFTLIELLAVIVILAIIALIATPIILGIINDAREKANERSIELYASAVRNGIAAYQLREGKEVKAGTYTSETLPFKVEYDGEVECTTIELYDNGGVYVAGCTVNDIEVEYTYGTKQVAKGTMGICNPMDVQIGGTYTAGDKYECDVDPNKEGYDYIFYVLTTPASGATSVNLIMDSNINISGNAVKGIETDLGKVAWHADDVDNSYGPITAMEYLQTATAGWTNVNPQTVSTFTKCPYGGGACTNEEMAETFTANARMPYYSEISNYSADANNAYLYENLQVECFDYIGLDTSCDSDDVDERYGVFAEGIDHMKGIMSYWTLSSATHYDVMGNDTSIAWGVGFGGSVHYTNIFIDVGAGVRPVINLSI